MTPMRFRNSALPSLIQNFFHQEGLNAFDPSQGNYLPPVNILEKDSGKEIHLYAPGLKKEQFRIQLKPKSLSISYQQEESREETHGKYLRREFRNSAFHRSFQLSETIDKEGISATYEDGILKVNLPSKEDNKVAQERTIEIR